MALEPEDSGPDPEEEGGGPIKSFLEHLEDLRWVLIKSGASLVLGMATCFAAAPKLVWILQWPLINSGTPIDLEWIGPMGAIVSTMKLAMYGGLIVAMPLILYFVGDFVVPALKRREKKYFLRAVMVGGGLFLGGVLFCYFFVLKISLLGMYQFTKWVGLPTNFWRAEEYFQFVTVLMLGMGLSFELPVIVLTLVKLGLMSHEFLVKSRRYFLIINLTLCAFITPDFLSTFFMVIPMQILLEGCIWISAYWQRQKRLAEAALESRGPQGSANGIVRS